MQAYQLVAWQQAPELREVDVPEPGPGEVLIKVGGAGACHSDLHVMEWPAGALPKLVPGTAVLVVGVGGLGHMAVQLVRAMSPADVIAVDVDPSKLMLAREVGASATVAAGDGAAEEVRELTAGRGVELVLDCVGTDPTMALDAASVANGGSVMVIGAAGGTL